METGPTSRRDSPDKGSSKVGYKSPVNVNLITSWHDLQIGNVPIALENIATCETSQAITSMAIITLINTQLSSIFINRQLSLIDKFHK